MLHFSARGCKTRPTCSLEVHPLATVRGKSHILMYSHNRRPSCWPVLNSCTHGQWTFCLQATGHSTSFFPSFFLWRQSPNRPRPPSCWGLRIYDSHERLIISSQKSPPSRHTKEHKRQTSLLSAGFEPAIPTMERLQTYALDRTATWSVRKSSKELYHKAVLFCPLSHVVLYISYIRLFNIILMSTRPQSHRLLSANIQIYLQ